MENFKSPEKIQKMFDEIADNYDFNNNIISLGLHKKIKKSAIKDFELPKEAKVLDLCTGTGDIAKLLSKKNNVKKITGLDFSKNMLAIAKKKNYSQKIEYIFGDCTNLPFEDNTFDGITMSFGLRNIQNTNKVLDEIKRVLKPNCVFLHIDFAKGNSILDKIFDFCIPIAIKLFYKNSVPYNYLIQSKQKFYTPKELETVLKEHGFTLKKERDYLFKTISAQTFCKN